MCDELSLAIERLIEESDKDTSKSSNDEGYYTVGLSAFEDVMELINQL